MAELLEEPDDFLESHMHLIVHWFLYRKRKQQLRDEGPLPRTRRQLKYQRRDAWQSIFGCDCLLNPNIQNPKHPEGIKFRRRFRVPYSVFLTIVDMFKSREGWNPPSSKDARAHAPHPLEIKILCSLFILGRGIDLDTVSMLLRISIGTLTSFFHHFCAKMAILYNEYIYMQKDNDLVAVTAQYARMGFPGCVGSTMMFCIYIKVKRASLQWHTPL